MRRVWWIAILVIASGFQAAAGRADDTGAVGARLQKMLGGFGRQAPPAQYAQMKEALAASPALVRQLNALAQAGRLDGFNILPREYIRKFDATIRNGRFVFTPDFLPRVATRAIVPVVQAGDPLPNNLVFVLGGLAAYLRLPKPSLKLDLSGYITAWRRTNARAFIDGWNDVVDAATRENGDRPLATPQCESLLSNLRYRQVFAQATMDKKITYTDTGTIEPTAQNIDALGEAIGSMKVLDFGYVLGE